MQSFPRKISCWALVVMLMPMMVAAQYEDPQPVAEVPCTLGVAATERRDSYRITNIESSSSLVPYYQCQLILADYDITIGETITLRDLPGNADYYEVVVAILEAEAEDFDATRLYFYTDTAIAFDTEDELEAAITPLVITPTEPSPADATDADLLPLYRQIVVLLIELLGLLEARAQ